MQERLRELGELRARVAEQAAQMEVLSSDHSTAQKASEQQALEMEERNRELEE
eukprot:CAMPEP_0170616280 /NCGR_PEP_ID=MMETSP0224-20130122/25787_1 /TAXON_ID=285029 /ORGANISM="Togula jolla, Strain CCCM 725" /LENGTH=52 /DNA_ID=CAMNT_0010942069 /DNA_START=1 /DNA_END=156 /DNA_ORIENTATION=-